MDRDYTKALLEQGQSVTQAGIVESTREILKGYGTVYSSMTDPIPQRVKRDVWEIQCNQVLCKETFQGFTKTQVEQQYGQHRSAAHPKVGQLFSEPQRPKRGAEAKKT